MEQQNNDFVKERQRNLNKPIYFLITALVGLLISVLVILMYQSRNDIFHLDNKIQLLTFFSDAFFTAGALIASVGGLVLISGEGLFDIISYGLSQVFSFVTNSKDRREHEKFYDYKLRKEAERGEGRIWFIAAVGVGFIVIALLLSIPFINPSKSRIRKGYEAAIITLQESVDTSTMTEKDAGFVYISYCDIEDSYNKHILYKLCYDDNEYFYAYSIKTKMIEQIDKAKYDRFYKYFEDGYASGTRGILN